MDPKKSLQLQQELSDAGLDYMGAIKEQGFFSTHKVFGQREYLAKAVSKADMFKYRQLRNAINREYLIADTVKRNFECLLGFYDFFYTQNYAVFLYEYCKEGSLEYIIDDPELKDKYKKIIISDVYKALKELRFLGIIHKNLHPSDIYISKYSLKVAGYAFCEQISHQKMHPIDFSYFLNTVPNFNSIAPELLTNRVPSLKSPLYSFGVLIYRLLSSGEYPVLETKLQDLRNGYRHRDFEILMPEGAEEISGETMFLPVLHGLLHFRPGERVSYVDLQEFLSQLSTDVKSFEDEPRYLMLSKKKRGQGGGQSIQPNIRKQSSFMSYRKTGTLASNPEHSYMPMGTKTFGRIGTFLNTNQAIPDDRMLRAESIQQSKIKKMDAPNMLSMTMGNGAANISEGKTKFPIITPYQDFEVRKHQKQLKDLEKKKREAKKEKNKIKKSRNFGRANKMKKMRLTSMTNFTPLKKSPLQTQQQNSEGIIVKLDVKEMERVKKKHRYTDSNFFAKKDQFRITNTIARRNKQQQNLKFFRNKSYYNLKGQSMVKNSSWRNLKLEPENFDLTLSYKTFYGQFGG